MKQPKFWNLSDGPDGAEIRLDGAIVADEWAWVYEWLNAPHTSPGSLRAQLKDLGGKPITLWIDSPGGDLEAGAAIYTALVEYPGEVTAKVEARAHSAASVVAMACETVLMSPVSTMMIHLPWTDAPVGNEHNARHMANVLAAHGETIVNAYAIKTNMPSADVRALLDADGGNGTWMSARRAVELGFADGMLYDMDSDQTEAAVVEQARAIYAMERPAPQGRAKPDNNDWLLDADDQLAVEAART